jgi:hypothetical protein
MLSSKIKRAKTVQNLSIPVNFRAKTRQTRSKPVNFRQFLTPFFT